MALFMNLEMPRSPILTVSLLVIRTLAALTSRWRMRARCRAWTPRHACRWRRPEDNPLEDHAGAGVGAASKPHELEAETTPISVQSTLTPPPLDELLAQSPPPHVHARG